MNITYYYYFLQLGKLYALWDKGANSCSNYFCVYIKIFFYSNMAVKLSKPFTSTTVYHTIYISNILMRFLNFLIKYNNLNLICLSVKYPLA